MAKTTKTGAEIIWECLREEGVEVVFGYPGGAILPAYDAMTRYPDIHHVLTRHEQGATHMADGYARASGKPGVVIATSGPGATNLVTGLGTAMMDSSPIVCITGQVPTTALGGDAFQETDTVGVSQPVVKHNYLVTEVNELAYTLGEAFHVARSGRPGPVLVDIPKNVQLQSCAYAPPEEPVRLASDQWAQAPGVGPYRSFDPDAIGRAVDLLMRAERPVLLVGQGVLKAGAHLEVLELAEKGEFPVALTLLGKGAFPERHPLCLGMMGMHGTAASNQAIQQADLLVALGMRFDDRVTGNLATYSPDSKKIHIDIDPAELGKNVPVDVGIACDLLPVTQALVAELEPRTHGPWLTVIRAWQAEDHGRDVLRNRGGRAGGGSRASGTSSGQPSPTEPLLAAEVLDALCRHTGGDGINVTDVGQHQMWEAQYFPHRRPGTLFTSGGMGTMGFALPAALGVKMARPDEEVWAIAGDGGFQMTMAELATAVQEGIELKIVIVNNGYLGMVRQWQELFYDERYHATPILSPDFCRIAEAYGIPAVRVSRRDQLGDAIDSTRRNRGGPILLEFVVEQHEAVFPMVPAGADLHAMIRRPREEMEMG